MYLDVYLLDRYTLDNMAIIVDGTGRGRRGRLAAAGAAHLVNKS